jgi:hypothetical protein
MSKALIRETEQDRARAHYSMGAEVCMTRRPCCASRIRPPHLSYSSTSSVSCRRLAGKATAESGRSMFKVTPWRAVS